MEFDNWWGVSIEVAMRRLVGINQRLVYTISNHIDSLVFVNWLQIRSVWLTSLEVNFNMQIKWSCKLIESLCDVLMVWTMHVPLFQRDLWYYTVCVHLNAGLVCNYELHLHGYVVQSLIDWLYNSNYYLHCAFFQLIFIIQWKVLNYLFCVIRGCHIVMLEWNSFGINIPQWKETLIIDHHHWNNQLDVALISIHSCC